MTAALDPTPTVPRNILDRPTTYVSGDDVRLAGQNVALIITRRISFEVGLPFSCKCYEIRYPHESVAMGLQGTFVRKAGILHAPVGSEALVMLSVDEGAYYNVNAVGRRIWELLAEPKTISELCSALCAEFDVDRTVCESQTAKFIDQMMESGIVRAAEV